MQLEGQLACAQGTLGFNPSSSAQPGWSSLSALSGAQFATPPAIAGFRLTGVDTYDLGFEEPFVFGPANKIAPESPVYEQFFNGAEEFAIYRNAGPVKFDWSTIAVLATGTQLCFLGVGVPLSFPPTTGVPLFEGIADGVVTGGSTVQRLFGSLAHAKFDHAAGTAAVAFELYGFGNALGAFGSAFGGPLLVTVVKGSGAGTPQRFAGTLTSEDGRFTGSFVGGLLGPGGVNAEIAFILSDGAQVQVIGAAALQNDNGAGAWDY